MKTPPSLQDRLYALDPLLGAQVRSRMDQLCTRIEDLEGAECDKHEAIIEDLTVKLAAAVARGVGNDFGAKI